MPCFHTLHGCAEKLNRHCGSHLGLGGSACSKIKRQRNRKTTKIRNISGDGYLDWLLHQNVFPLREYHSILSGKSKGFTFEELFRSSFTELDFEFDYKKELTLKVSFKFIRL